MTVTTVEVFDDDGVLALVDLATYHPFVSEHWDLDGLLGHFDAEMQARHAIVWRCGDQGGDEWQVEFRPIRSTAVAHREFTAAITVSDRRLHLLNYTDLTMAAADPEVQLPMRLGEQWFVELDPGPYEITVRQLFDPEVDLSAETGPSFEIVWALNAGTPAARVEQVAWWDG